MVRFSIDNQVVSNISIQSPFFHLEKNNTYDDKLRKQEDSGFSSTSSFEVDPHKVVVSSRNESQINTLGKIPGNRRASDTRALQRRRTDAEELGGRGKKRRSSEPWRELLEYLKVKRSSSGQIDQDNFISQSGHYWKLDERETRLWEECKEIYEERKESLETKLEPTILDSIETSKSKMDSDEYAAQEWQRNSFAVEKKRSSEDNESYNERDWDHSHLKMRLRVMDMEELFASYLHRLRHVMLVNYLFLQFILSTVYIILILCAEFIPGSSISDGVEGGTISTGEFIEKEYFPELFAQAVLFASSLVMLTFFYNEACFRANPKLHSVFGFSITVLLNAVSVSVSLTSLFLYEKEEEKLKYGNPLYTLVVIYIFLPFEHPWHGTVAGVLSTITHLAMEAMVYYIGYQTNEAAIRLGVSATYLVSGNLVGAYSRHLTEIAFKRAFLDKESGLETKFKLETAKKQEENLLLSILPKNLMSEVKKDFREQIDNIHNKPSAVKRFSNLYVERHEKVSILYADICNFTPLTTKLRVDKLVEMLNDLFGEFDEAAEHHNCLRIKILGDCYYCVSGVPEYTKDHALNCVRLGFDMIHIIKEVREENKVDVDMRIGIHSGSVLSGLIGTRKWQFDVWSNDVTIANHMEQTGEKGCVHVTQQTRSFLPPNAYDFRPSLARRRSSLLDREKVDTYFVIPKQPQQRRESTFVGPRISIAPQRNLEEDNISDLYERISRVNSIRKPNGYRPDMRRRSTVVPSALQRRTIAACDIIDNYNKVLTQSKDSMMKAVETMPLTKMDQWLRPEGINPLTLSFNKEKWELPFSRQPDPLFKNYLLCSAAVYFIVFVTQIILFPRNDMLLYLGVSFLLVLILLLSLCWVSTLYLKIKDPYDELYISEEDTLPLLRAFMHTDKFIMTSLITRSLMFILVSVGLFIAAVAKLQECENYMRSTNGSDVATTVDSLLSSTIEQVTTPPYYNTSDSTHVIDYSEGQRTSTGDIVLCSPWVFTDSVSICLLAVWGFFRIHFLLKLSSYAIGIVLYAVSIVLMAEELYAPFSNDLAASNSLEPLVSHIMMVVSIALALHLMDRQMEYIMRLDFQWKQQLMREQLETEETHMANKILLRNILPQHLADKFLTSSIGNELYHESYNHVAVMFASIPNYSEFYKEHEFNDDGKGCLKVLNGIIVDFDLLTLRLNFQSIEKIKIVGSTYMAACGLQPGIRSSDDAEFEERDLIDNVETLAYFAAAMFAKLETINKESFQNFELRIGIDVGPVIAGVIGAQKPMYDIWGNTVNVASRMDYTGQMGQIHVTEKVGKILHERGWHVECRGEIDVKGKGKMITYFVDPSSAPKTTLSKSHDVGSDGVQKRRTNGVNRRGSDSPLSTSLKKTSFSSLKTLLESTKSNKRGSLDIQTEERSNSLSSNDVKVRGSSHALSNTLPAKFKNIRKSLIDQNSPLVLGLSLKENSSDIDSSENIITPNSEEVQMALAYDQPLPPISDRLRLKYYSALEKCSEADETNPDNTDGEEMSKLDNDITSSKSYNREEPSILGNIIDGTTSDTHTSKIKNNYLTKVSRGSASVRFDTSNSHEGFYPSKSETIIKKSIIKESETLSTIQDANISEEVILDSKPNKSHSSIL